MSESPKLDAGKPPVALVVPQFILGIAQVMGFGAKKYPAWSWTKGKKWSRDYSAVMRHVLMFWAGQDLDPESGLHHLLHASCDIMFLFVSWLKGIGTDDRHKFPPDVLREMNEALKAVEAAHAAKEPRHDDHLPQDAWDKSCSNNIGFDLEGTGKFDVYKGWGCTRPADHEGDCEYSGVIDGIITTVRRRSK